MKHKLQNKFLKEFIIPLFCGILISILLTGIILVTYTGYLSTDPTLMEIIKEKELNISLPYLLTARNFIYRHYQESINSVNSIYDYYKFLKNNTTLNFDKAFMKKFIQNYSYENLYMKDNYINIINTITQNKNDLDNYLNFASWFIGPGQNNLDTLTDLQLKHLYISVNMIPILRANFEITKKNPKTGIILSYIAFLKSNLFFRYPLSSGQELDYNPYNGTSTWNNPDYCRNSTGQIPDYYYFRCRDWYGQVMMMKESLGFPITITIPYKFNIGGELGISVCINFLDMFEASPKDYEDDIVICLDVSNNFITSQLNQFNQNIYGYYFISRIQSDFPIYYPNQDAYPSYLTITRYEFDLNTTFYLNELDEYAIAANEFKKYISEAEIKNYNYDSMESYALRKSIKNITGSYRKWNSETSYTIYPISFYIDPLKPRNKTHFMSLIYIYENDFSATMLSRFQKNLTWRIVLQVILFFTMGAILLLIGWNLLIGIAISIVRPIKNLKNLLLGLNTKAKQFEIVENVNLKEPEVDYDFLISEDDNENDDDEKKDDENDELLDLRSKEIQDLLDKLLRLKNVINFTTNPITEDNETVLSLIYSKYTFVDVQNDKGRLVCDSNLGNINLKLEKYDKAIFHLLESIQNNSTYNNFYDMLIENKPKRTSNYIINLI